jgi:glycosyltransferase involved in cell wall biosynthesis
VLHVYSGNLYGGIETFLRTIALQPAPALATMDYALCFDGRLARELRAAGANVTVLGDVRLRSPRAVRAVRRTFARLLREQRYDVVVSHSVWSHVVFGPVVREHGARFVCYLHDVANRTGWIDRWASLTPPDLVLCNSAFTERASRWLFRRTRRRTLYLPLAPSGPSDRSRDTLRASLGTDPAAVVLLQASRMEAWKGQRLLIDALHALRANPKWTCWIAGGPQRPAEAEYQAELAAMVERLGLSSRIQFLGQRDDVASLMAAADVYCQPNVRPEPFGLAFVEALAAGLPVIATAMGGALEIVAPDCGALTAPEPAALSAAIAAYVDGEAMRKGVATTGPRRARELCDAAQRTGDLVDELVRVASPRTGADSFAPGAG